MTTVTKVQGMGQITNDSGPKVTLGVRSLGPATGKETDSGNNVIWGGKTYRITVVKKGKACNPTTPEEWDQLKAEYLKMLDELDETLKKVDKSATSVLNGASRFSHSLTKKTFSAIKDGQKVRTVDLQKDFRSFPDDLQKIELRSAKVSTMIKSFNPNQAKKEPETSPSEKNPSSGNTSSAENVDSDEESSSSSSSSSSSASSKPPKGRTKRKTKKSQRDADAKSPAQRRAKTPFANEPKGSVIPPAQTTHTSTVTVDPRKYNGLADMGIINDFLNPKACIEDAAIVNYLEILQKDPDNKLKLEFAQIPLGNEKPNFIDIISDAFEAKNLFDVRSQYVFAIPILHNGHFTALLVNFKTHEICYYDAFGKMPYAKVQSAIEDLIKDLNGAVGVDEDDLNQKPWEFNINNVRHQQDGHNCGPFVLKCIHDVVSGKSFTDYKKTDFTTQTAVKQLRVDLLAYYLPKIEEVERARRASLQPVHNSAAKTSSSDSEDSDSTSSDAEELDDL